MAKAKKTTESYTTSNDRTSFITDLMALSSGLEQMIRLIDPTNITDDTKSELTRILNESFTKLASHYAYSILLDDNKVKEGIDTEINNITISDDTPDAITITYSI